MDRRRELLVMARERMARLPLDTIDVLVLDFIARTSAGWAWIPTSLAATTPGRPARAEYPANRRPRPDRRTEGNAVGIGMADRRVAGRAVEKMTPQEY